MLVIILPPDAGAPPHSEILPEKMSEFSTDGVDAKRFASELISL